MTEEQAKKKWCPMVRETTEQMGSYNRFKGLPITNSLCLASNCMMWRWDWIGQDKYSEKEGNCGLAG